MSTTPDHSHTAAGVAQFAYPTSALLSFLALRSICLYSGQRAMPQIDLSVVRRNVLLGLVALIISTYAASSINIFVRAITHSKTGIDEGRQYYILYAAVVWTIEILFWPRESEYVWFPYLVSSIICALGEVIILESSLTSTLAFDVYDLLSFNIQCFRIAALLLLPAIYLGQKLSKSTGSTDEERQSLLPDSEISSNDDQPTQHKGYGSLGKQIAIRDYARSGTDGTKSSTDEIRDNQSTISRGGRSEGAAERILVIENGQAVAFGTPQDIVRAVSAESDILPILAKLDTRIETTQKMRNATPTTRDTVSKKEAAVKSLATASEAAAGINAAKSTASALEKIGGPSVTPTRKGATPAESKGDALLGSAHAHSHAAQTNDKPEMSMVTSVTSRQSPGNLEDTGKNAATPPTAQKVADTKTDSTTPITIRRASVKRDQSKSPSKSLHASSSSVTKLKPDVPEFIPRSLRNSTEASACSRPHTPSAYSHSREGSRSSSPSKFTAHAPEFIPRHMRSSTDASTSSGPHSPGTTHALLNRPVSPLKLYEVKAASPKAIGAGSPKPQFNSSTNLNDKTSHPDSHCTRHGKHLPGPAMRSASLKPTDPALSKAHLNRYGRRDIAKSEPANASQSQMSGSHDGAQDQGSSLGSSADTTLKKSAPKKGVQKQHRRVTAPSDPPSGVESKDAPKRSIGRSVTKKPKRARHWRVARRLNSRAGAGTSSMASESSVGGSSVGGSEANGGVPRAPVPSPSVGPVPGYAYTGMN